MQVAARGEAVFRSMFYSLTINIFSRKFFALLFLCFCTTILKAETLDLRLEVSAARLIVSGKFSSPQNSAKSLQTRWLFSDQYADAVNLSRRFSKPEFFDVFGAAITSRTKASNEFIAARPIDSWKYEVNLEMPAEAMTAAHVSWLKESGGLLMPADLLPQLDGKEVVSARVKIALPAGWKIATVENKIGENEFSVADVEKAVFLVGKDFTEQTGLIGKTEFRIASAGIWTFSSDDIVTMASQILEEHRRTFGETSANRFQLILLPLPPSVNADRWRAETRGASIVLLSGAIPFKSIALNRLHEQLRHEIFHFWIPNGLNLSGSYDWFYEGFTLYQALKTGVRLDYIRFEDFLDTLSRAVDVARRAQNTNQISLLDASRERWRGGANLIYAKGMVVAFLCDAALLNQTGGKDSLSDVFRELYRKHNLANARIEGNAASLAILKKYPQLAGIVQKYVEQAGVIEPKTFEDLSGLVNLSNANFTKLAIGSSLNGRQKKVLEKLGYKRS
jgi:predicted metalloprotease with PDZ domain